MALSGSHSTAGAPDTASLEKAGSGSPVEALLERYEELKVGIEKIDPFFVWQDGKRPDMVHDAYDDEVPVIDLSPVLKLARVRAEIASRPDPDGSLQEEVATCEAGAVAVQREIRAACEDYGVFQIVNHGFPLELIEKLTEFARQIFELPLELKSKVPGEPIPGKPPRAGYGAMKRSSVASKTKHGHIWNEAFDYEYPEILYPGTVEWFGNNFWPEESGKSSKGLLFQSTTEDFGRESVKLVSNLLDLMTSSLGLPADSFQSLLNLPAAAPPSLRIKINHFPVCPQPELTWGIHGHTDPCILTWVHQDSVGGLQFCFKDGTWHGVRPMRNALVINVGDYLQAWTNGRFISAEHRVVANEKKPRFSIANFVLGNLDMVTPRSELVDAEHPLLYRPFSRREYMGMLIRNGLNEDRTAVLDYFHA